jgi:hypothetical protein
LWVALDDLADCWTLDLDLANDFDFDFSTLLFDLPADLADLEFELFWDLVSDFDRDLYPCFFEVICLALVAFDFDFDWDLDLSDFEWDTDFDLVLLPTANSFFEWDLLTDLDPYLEADFDLDLDLST